MVPLLQLLYHNSFSQECPSSRSLGLLPPFLSPVVPASPPPPRGGTHAGFFPPFRSSVVQVGRTHPAPSCRNSSLVLPSCPGWPHSKVIKRSRYNPKRQSNRHPRRVSFPSLSPWFDCFLCFQAPVLFLHRCGAPMIVFLLFAHESALPFQRQRVFFFFFSWFPPPSLCPLPHSRPPPLVDRSLEHHLCTTRVLPLLSDLFQAFAMGPCPPFRALPYTRILS